MKPLLAHIYEPHRVTYPCYVQPKLNGVRALYQNGRFQSRDQVPFPMGLLDHLARPLLECFDPHTILDGELYIHGWPLQKILGAITPIRGEANEDTLKVEYHVFDIVDFEKSFEERFKYYVKRELLRERFSGTSIRFVNARKVETSCEADANLYYSNFVSQGYEGMMYRLGDCPYTRPKQKAHTDGLTHLWSGIPKVRPSTFLSDKDNRCWHLLKRKDWQDDEFDFISLEETTGALGERGFIMWVRATNGRSFKLGSGLSQTELDYYLSNPPINHKIKAKYLVLSSDGIPLNATILTIL